MEKEILTLLIENNSYLKVLFEQKAAEISGEKSGDKYMKVYKELEEERQTYVNTTMKLIFGSN